MARAFPAGAAFFLEADSAPIRSHRHHPFEVTFCRPGFARSVRARLGTVLRITGGFRASPTLVRYEVIGVTQQAGAASGWHAHPRRVFRRRTGARSLDRAGPPVECWRERSGLNSRESIVPLSEHEQRQFEQIEQALRAGDPRFAHAVRAADPRARYKRRVIRATLGFLIGIGLLLAGVVINVALIGVAGFLLMLAGSMRAVTSYRRMTGTATGRVPAQDRRAGKRAGARLIERLEERWRRRRENDR